MPMPVAAAPVQAASAQAAVANTPGPATPSSKNDGASVLAIDFASLLQGRFGINPIADTAPPPRKDAADKADDSAATDTGTQDPALLFAALGLPMTPPPLPKAATPLPLAPGIAPPLAPGVTPDIEFKRAAAAGKDIPDKVASKVAAFGGSDDKAAKFAVAEISAKPSETATLPLPEGDTRTASLMAAAPNTSRPMETSLNVSTPIREQSWATDFGQKVVWLANNEKQFAHISLNPPQLGPIEISLSVNNDQASAIFASPHAAVREAIEAALPQLRDMLAGAGIELGQANVSAESFPQQQQQQQARNPRQSAPRFDADNAILGADSIHHGGTAAAISHSAIGLVNTFA